MNCKLLPVFPTINVVHQLLRLYIKVSLLPILDTTKKATDLQVTFLLKRTLVHFYLLNLVLVKFFLMKLLKELIPREYAQSEM